MCMEYKKGVMSPLAYLIPRLAKALFTSMRKRPTPRMGRERFTLFS